MRDSGGLNDSHAFELNRLVAEMVKWFELDEPGAEIIEQLTEIALLSE
jgi:hypothetical protein